MNSRVFGYLLLLLFMVLNSCKMFHEAEFDGQENYVANRQLLAARELPADDLLPFQLVFDTPKTLTVGDEFSFPVILVNCGDQDQYGSERPAEKVEVFFRMLGTRTWKGADGRTVDEPFNPVNGGGGSNILFLKLGSRYGRLYPCHFKLGYLLPGNYDMAVVKRGVFSTGIVKAYRSVTIIAGNRNK